MPTYEPTTLLRWRRLKAEEDAVFDLQTDDGSNFDFPYVLEQASMDRETGNLIWETVDIVDVPAPESDATS